MDIPVLDTPRLRLREFREEDLDEYAAMCGDAEVMRYVRGHAIDRAEAWREMAMFAGHWALRGYGMWAVEERESGTLVGRIGLHYPEGWPDRELGWALRRGFWGRGYATQGCRAALDHAFATLGWPRVISLIHPENERSKRLATRLGMRLERAVNVRGADVDLFAAVPERRSLCTPVSTPPDGVARRHPRSRVRWRRDPRSSLVVGRRLFRTARCVACVEPEALALQVQPLAGQPEHARCHLHVAVGGVQGVGHHSAFETLARGGERLVVANRANLFERLALRIGQRPVVAVDSVPSGRFGTIARGAAAGLQGATTGNKSLTRDPRRSDARQAGSAAARRT